jgi:Rps23 Pro-64 3,4-dihydroxylase Tpa1-like proline 4-hydroxylase
LMSDQGSLNSWIQPHHLRTEAIKNHHRLFTSHPARALVIKRFLLDEVAERLTRFLTQEADFTPSFGLYSDANRHGNVSDISERAWLEAEAQSRFYRFSEITGALARYRSSSNLTTFREFVAALKGGEFRRYFEEVSGLELGQTPLVNAYSYKVGDFLSMHTDDVKDKRLSFVFYLSPQWGPDFGGTLHLIEPDGNVLRVSPEHNSLVIFDVTAKTKHFISPVEAGAGDRARLTISGWFLTPRHQES